MAVTGHYMAWQVRTSAVHNTSAFVECILRDLLPAFGDIEKKSEAAADAGFKRLGSRPAGEDCDGDMSSLAETATEKGIAFYETMTAIRQATLNLYAVGLFHLLEQCLAHLCCDRASHVSPPEDTNLKDVTKWIRKNFNFNFGASAYWKLIDELRLVAHTVKHAEGGSARQLRQRRPELFEHPISRQLWPKGGCCRVASPIHLPLAGADLYITEEQFREYGQAVICLMQEICEYFEAHKDVSYLT
jgi:hypothetical protein